MIRPRLNEKRPRLNEPLIPPHIISTVVDGKRIRIVTSKLQGAPWYLFSAYMEDDDKVPFLRLLSYPCKDDLKTALHSFLRKRKKEVA